MNESPAPFNLATVQELLDGNPFGADLRYVPEVGSTNQIAADPQPGSWQNGTTFFTDLQNAGRGRLGRAWNAPLGSSVLASVILAPVGRVFPAYYVFIASLSVTDALKKTADLQPSIKWPNDVHVNGRKIAGILVESRTHPDDRIVVGIGINANLSVSVLADLNPSATSVLVETGRLVSRETLAANLLRSLELWYRCLTRDPYDVFTAWKGRLDTLGSPLQIHDSRGTWTGVGMDVQEDGGLIVERADGKRQTVYAADVSVRPRSGLQAP